MLGHDAGAAAHVGDAAWRMPVGRIPQQQRNGAQPYGMLAEAVATGFAVMLDDLLAQASMVPKVADVVSAGVTF
jgi:hypothetical protein